MLPFVFDWYWTIDRLIFMGVLWGVLTIVGVGLGIAFLTTLGNLYRGDAPSHHH